MKSVKQKEIVISSSIDDTKSGDKAKSISLEKSLRPLWKITFNLYLLFDWCRPVPNQSQLSVLVRYIVIFLSLSLIILSLIFQSVQLVLEMMKENASIHSIMTNLMWFSNLPIILISAIYFLHRRDEFLNYFQKFDAFERNSCDTLKLSDNKLSRQFKRLYKIVYTTHFLMDLFTALGIFIFMYRNINASYMLAYYPIFIETLTLPGIFVFHMVGFFLIFLFVGLAELVPAWTYYHIGTSLQSLAIQIENECCFKSSEFELAGKDIMRQLRNSYETISELTDGANRIFGILMIVTHIISSFLVSAMFYTILSNIREPNMDTLSFLIGLITISTRLVKRTLMAAHVHNSSKRLRVALTIALSRETLSPEESNLAGQILSRMKENPLVASPLNLYDITSSLLFTFVSFVLSYVIILLRLRSAK